MFDSLSFFKEDNKLNTNIKFLVIDDFSGMRERIKQLLHEIGFCHVGEAEDGNVALHKLKHESFDFIVANWHMSSMDGLTVLQNIRATETLKEIPVLMVTADAKKKNVLAAAQAGANGYLVGPFSAAILRDKLNIIFKNISNQSESLSIPSKVDRQRIMHHYA